MIGCLNTDKYRHVRSQAQSSSHVIRVSTIINVITITSVYCYQSKSKYLFRHHLSLGQSMHIFFLFASLQLYSHAYQFAMSACSLDCLTIMRNLPSTDSK